MNSLNLSAGKENYLTFTITILMVNKKFLS